MAHSIGEVFGHTIFAICHSFTFSNIRLYAVGIG